MKFIIEKGIISTTKKISKFDEIPVNQMIIGDSIFIPSTFLLKDRLQKCLKIYNEQNNVLIKTKTEETGTRIFRIK